MVLSPPSLRAIESAGELLSRGNTSASYKSETSPVNSKVPDGGVLDLARKSLLGGGFGTLFCHHWGTIKAS